MVLRLLLNMGAVVETAKKNGLNSRIGPQHKSFSRVFLKTLIYIQEKSVLKNSKVRSDMHICTEYAAS